MRLPKDERLREEAERFALCFCCEECCFLDRATRCCVHGWPNELHLRARYEDRSVAYVVFCKEFELV